MRNFWILFLLLSAGSSAQAKVQTTSAYECKFNLANADGSYLRLKQYPGPDQNSDLGKIDVMIGNVVRETTVTKIYKIPFYDEKIYVQIWYAAESRVDAQFSMTGANHRLPATYRKGSLQQEVICTNISE